MRSEASSKIITAAQDSPQRMVVDYTDFFSDADALTDFLMLEHEEQEAKLCALAAQKCVYRVQTVFDMPQVKEAKGEAMRSAIDIANRMAEHRKNAQEGFWVLTLNQKHRIIGTHLVSLGTLTASLVHPREVFRPAILDSAACVAFVHNHPSGDPTPSREDRDITRRLNSASEIMGIPILDHVILGYREDGGVSYSSLAEEGLV